ncbi:PHB/PHA accumulation regulator DNA-binding domain protein [Methyloligella halotolerans]|uniref:PHB/PHA accumulation regulator DNA-binding domain protein n=1 Tax=Methyloligella halotolerans TaxID=1177755 RepID=A0A1E2RVG9_9HYPH|nr:polyhydroxyalkanoate synthesis repressor PhaR [Methyloligella halotolerans]ODA66246.1 PHB/PHA accumulation regulator DNA-binding domain protein [Methyloligella halotolerans]
MARDSEHDAKPVIIKKYANRRLYNTDTSSYVTLEDLAAMVRSERDFVVFDAKSGEDLTHSVLTQIIVDQESRGENLLPIPFLRQLIRFYGDSLQMVVPSYLEMSLNTLTKQQDQYRGHFGTAAFDAMQDQVRKNFETFEHAMGLFSPFGAGDAPAKGSKPENGVKSQSCAAGDTATKERDKSGEIENLKAELSAMQERLEQLSRRSS